MRSRTSLCREGWYYLMIMVMVFAGAMFKEVNLLLLLGGMMLGPLFFNRRAVHLTLRGLDFQRKSPQAVCAGDPLTVGMRLINKRKHFGSWAVTIEERIQRQSDAAASHSHWNHPVKEKSLKTAVYFPYVPAGQERTETYRGRLFEPPPHDAPSLLVSSCCVVHDTPPFSEKNALPSRANVMAWLSPQSRIVPFKYPMRRSDLVGA
jgi:hypothetical protein